MEICVCGRTSDEHSVVELARCMEALTVAMVAQLKGPIAFVKARRYFVASLCARHIHSAWDTREDALEAQRDLTGHGAPLDGMVDYRVYTRNTMERMGLVKGVR